MERSAHGELGADVLDGGGTTGTWPAHEPAPTSCCISQSRPLISPRGCERADAAWVTDVMQSAHRSERGCRTGGARRTDICQDGRLPGGGMNGKTDPSHSYTGWSSGLQSPAWGRCRAGSRGPAPKRRAPAALIVNKQSLLPFVRPANTSAPPSACPVRAPAAPSRPAPPLSVRPLTGCRQQGERSRLPA